MNDIWMSKHHKRQFEQLIRADGTADWDIERRSMFYIISGNQELFMHADDIYNFSGRHLRSRYMKKLAFLCSSSLCLLRLSVNLYNGTGRYGTDPHCIFSTLDRRNRTLAVNAISMRYF